MSTSSFYKVLFILLFFSTFFLQMDLSLSTDASSYDNTVLRKHIPKLIGSGEDIIDHSITIIVDRIENHSTSPTNPNSPVELENDFVKMAISETLVDHDPISINGNNDFINQATVEGWSGNGTESNPFIISGYYINGSSTLIEIRNTDIDFQIVNCLLREGGSHGIYFFNTTSGFITNNTVNDCYNSGIYLQKSTNTNVTINSIQNNDGSGIVVREANSSSVLNNIVHNNGNEGITVSLSTDVLIFNNSIVNHGGCGVLISSSPNIVVLNNSIINCGDGIYLEGIFGFNENVTIHENYIYNNNFDGIYLDNSRKINISLNIISFSRKYGIHLSDSTFNTSVTWNNFFSNNASGNQAKDVEFLGGNIFAFNYWDDWTNPDVNGDLLVDNPYFIEGSANNQDSYPHVFPVQTVQHNPILIYGNSDLINQAALEEWQGNGSFSDPYTISNYYFNALSGPSIRISDVDIYFRIENCIFRGGDIGIYLINAKYCTVSDNILLEQNMWGIRINSQAGGLSNNLIIINNIIKGNNILVEFGPTNIIIANNTIFNCTNSGGVVIKDSNDILVANNTIHNSRDGIKVIGSDNVTVSSNKVYNNLNTGIELQDSQSEVLNNCVFNNSGDAGILIMYSASGNRILNNSIYYNYRGIYITSSNNSIVSGNTIHHNTRYGVHITNYAFNISIKFNNLISNELCQAYDEGGQNITFAFNYWNDWVNPDINADGIVDNPYLVDGPANNQDRYPLTALVEFPTHLLLKPSIIYPIGGETLSGSITVEWTKSVCSLGHDITYSVYYSSDGGVSWILIVGDLLTTNLNWETTTVNDSSEYLIKLLVNCSEGLTSEIILADSFIIDNRAPNIVLINLQNDTTLISLDTIDLFITDSSLENVSFNWDSGVNESMVSPYQVIVPSSEGYHWLTVYANDSVGHLTVKKYRWWINQVPSINLESPANNTIQKDGTTIILNVEDNNLDVVWYNWDNGANQSFITPWNVTLSLSDGWHRLNVYANDTNGFLSSTQFFFYSDLVSPVILLINPVNDTSIETLLVIELEITDYSLDNVWYNWDDGMNQSLTSPYQIGVPIEEGYHWLTVYATDSVGHVTVQKYRWSILIPTTTTTTTTSTTSSTSTPSTSTRMSAPRITHGFEFLPLLIALLSIITMLRRARR